MAFYSIALGSGGSSPLTVVLTGLVSKAGKIRVLILAARPFQVVLDILDSYDLSLSQSVRRNLLVADCLSQQIAADRAVGIFVVKILNGLGDRPEYFLVCIHCITSSYSNNGGLFHNLQHCLKS